MDEKTRLGLVTLAAALVLGVLGDTLLRETPWGLNVALWLLAVAATVVAVARFFGWMLRGDAPWLLAAAFLFAAFLAWRASATLAVLNLGTSLTCLALAAGRSPAIRRAGVLRYLVEPALLVGQAFAAVFMLAIEDVDWKEIPRGRWSQQTVAVLRGLAVALPLLLLFGGLFAAADAVFENLVTGIVDVEQPLTHVFVTLVAAWVAAGFLRHVLAERTPAAAADDEPRPPLLGAVETTIALALLDALFLAFVLVQLRYLFGGDERVQEVAGLTYAEYARRGFFELVAVALLVVPLLLVADCLVRRGTRRHLLLFRTLASALVVLLLVVMASALERMRIYVDAYGLTELRVYTTAFMLWLGFVALWLLATVLRGRRPRFAFGSFVAALVTLVALNAMNPDATIARVNLDHADSAVGFDYAYASDLGADAVPTLLARYDELGRDARVMVACEVLDESREQGWRSWNWGRSRAQQAAGAMLPQLQADLRQGTTP